MSNRVKNSIYTVLLLVSVFLVWKWRNSNQTLEKTVFKGNTMGTTYKIIAFGEQNFNLQSQVDSVLRVFNRSMSTYDPESEISRFNQSNTLNFDSPFFFEVLKESKAVFTQSAGSFDPTVMPLVRIWGFGPDKLSAPDSTVVDSVKNFVGFGNISFDEEKVVKNKTGVELDFSAIAKGYGVDLISEFLHNKGYENSFVEIGGEVRVRGNNLENKGPWRIGITDPLSDRFDVRLFGSLPVTNVSIATSGNYFNYYIVDGRRYSHTLSPDTGYPVQQEILSATVVAESCMKADAWATAFMVMGHEKAIEILQSNNALEGILLYSGKDGEVKSFVSEKLKDEFKKL